MTICIKGPIYLMFVTFAVIITKH